MWSHPVGTPWLLLATYGLLELLVLMSELLLPLLVPPALLAPPWLELLLGIADEFVLIALPLLDPRSVPY